MATAGTLEYLISVDSSQLSRALSNAESKISSFSVAAGNILSKLAMDATKAVINFGKSAVTESMAYDKAMSQVAATMGKSVVEIQQLNNFARQMGLEGAYNATEVAQALNYMALAGYDAETSMRMLPQVLDLAAAGDMDLARASDVVTDAQKAFNLTLDETEVMVDQMAKTASITNTSVAQLGEAYLTVGANAQSLKGGTRELSAMLGVLANNGIKGAEGGTALRNVLLKLTDPSGKAAKQLKDLGVSAYDANTHELRELPEIFMDLNKALEGKTMEQKAEIFSKAFNVRDIRAVKALLGTTSDEWIQLYEEIGNAYAGDSAGKMAKTQLDNLSGDVQKFNNRLQEAKLTIMKGLTPKLREFVQKGITWLDRITDAFKGGGLTGAIREANNIFTEFIDSLKSSDSPVLQIVGKGLEHVKNLASEVYGLITDFPGKLKEWKESDSPGLNALSGILGTVKVAVDTIITAFNEGIPAAVQGLREIDTPLSNLAAGALEALYNICDFFVQNVGLDGTITAVATAFALFKGIEITGSLISFVSKLSSIRNAGQLNQLLNGLQGAGVPSAGAPAAGAPAAGAPAAGAPAAGAAAGSGATGAGGAAAAGGASKGLIGSLFGPGTSFSMMGGAATALPLLGMGLAGFVGAKMVEANLNDAELNKVFGTTGETNDSIIDTMSENAVKAAKAYWDVYQKTGSEEAMTAREKLFSILESEGYEHTELGVEFIEQMFDNILSDNDLDGTAAKIWQKFFEAGEKPLTEAGMQAKQQIKDNFEWFRTNLGGDRGKYNDQMREYLENAGLSGKRLEDALAKLDYNSLMQARANMGQGFDQYFNGMLDDILSDVPITLTPDDSAITAKLSEGYTANVTLVPVGGIAKKAFGQAKGDWNVPYDNYPSLLHRGEMVLTASQARRYRDGDSGGSAEVVGAIQSLGNKMANLQLVVGQKTFGRAVVNYGGRRMNDYIGGSESRRAAGYGT